MSTTRVAIVGARGYTGVELVEILSTHASVEIVGLFGSGRPESVDSKSVAESAPRLRGRCELPILAFDHDSLLALEPGVVFLATPHEASNRIAPGLLDAGIVVLDISGAFRLVDEDAHAAAYGFSRPTLEAAYALPEHNRAVIAGADLLACPGCYATASILGLRPLVEAGLIRPETRPVIDAVSGVSGAGRTASERTHFCEVSLQPYNVLGHRHQPEIGEHAGVPVHFVPHLGAFERGIVATVHCELVAGATSSDVGDAMQAAYAAEPFVRLLSRGQWPSVGAVERTNFCDIAWVVDEGAHHAVICAAIDNLVKGASGQAVQAMNIRLGFPERDLGPYTPACLSGEVVS